MSSLDYLDLCRLCLVKDRANVPIFEGEGDVRQIFFKIAACLPVKVVKEDNLPKKICDDCVYKVEQFYQFWNTTANVEKQLLQWLGDVGMEEKQGYVSGILNPDQSVEGRLNANVIQQTDEHQNNMGMNMMDTMNLDMPMMMQTEQSQMTTMNSNDTNVQTIQAVPGTSVRPPQQERRKDDEDESSEDEDNSDDECDADEGLSVKEETEETANRTIEPTFVNVSLPCDEAGPSGLQQQKINEMSDMVMTQSTDGDPKSGFIKRTEVGADNFRGLFIFDRESVIMKKWQVLEFDGKPYYAFVPVNEEPINPDDIPIIDEDENSNDSKITTKDIDKEESTKIGNMYDESMDNDESFYEYDYIENDSDKEDQNEKQEMKPILINGIDDENKDPAHGDLYQVKIEGSLITLEKLAENVDGSKVEHDESILPEIVNENEKIFLAKVQDPSFDAELQQSSGEEEEEQVQEVPQYEEREIENTDTGIMEYISVEEGGEEEEEREEDVDDVKAIVSTAQKPSHGKIRSRTRYRPILPNPTTALKCKACSETFGSAIAFRKHVAWTHKKKVCIQENGAYICAVCDYRTLKKSLFASHLERKHETWPQKCLNLVFPCSACGFVCRSKHSLQSHFIRKHTDKFEHQCKFCPKKFKVKGDLTNHVRFHHREKPINCDVCGKLCQNTGSLYVHQKWAHYKPKFECSVCKRRMVTQENLDQHMITQHEKRENIICQECGKSFTKKDSFKRHMAVHTGSKPHHCPICNKPFARQSQLRQHVLIHTGKRPFICDICGKAFTQKPGLICHRKTHPGSHPPLPVMPIADFVKEFTAGYLLQGPGAIVEEDAEGVSE